MHSIDNSSIDLVLKDKVSKSPKIEYLFMDLYVLVENIRRHLEDCAYVDVKPRVDLRIARLLFFF